MADSPSKDAYGVIGIHQLRIDCIVGIYPAERQQPQTLYVDVKIKMDFAPCLMSGKIADTVDYVMIAQLCTELAQRKNYHLLEAFASDILEECKNRYQACWVWVSIQKPSAIPSAAYAFVEMEYHKKENAYVGASNRGG